MALTKAQRAALRAKFNGRCAYCGDPLPERWHADHIEPVVRNDWFRRAGLREAHRPPDHPERDTLENMNPACPPCNIDKHSLSLENWRELMQRSNEVLMRDVSTFRRAVRYRLVELKSDPVVFYFERLQRSPARSNTMTNTDTLTETMRAAIGPLLNEFGERQWQSGRGVAHKSLEQAFEAIIERAALVAPVPSGPAREPLTDEQIKATSRAYPAEDLCGWSYRMGIADAEKHHGITAAREAMP